jgi:hypothetical protein
MKWENNARAEQAAYENIIGRMRISWWITKATNTSSFSSS